MGYDTYHCINYLLLKYEVTSFDPNTHMKARCSFVNL